MSRTIVLAYSGGLDTSVCVRWLADRGWRVICFMADVGAAPPAVRGTSSPARIVPARSSAAGDGSPGSGVTRPLFAIFERLSISKRLG